MTEYIVPAQIDQELSRKIQGIALKVFHAIGCRDLARIDFIVDEERRPFVLEVNTIPGFTATSLLPMAAQVTGCDFQNLCLRLARFAAARKSSGVSCNRE
jgi:D-alanine-D-alanine ligase-like ATP-grasp enzyme